MQPPLKPEEAYSTVGSEEELLWNYEKPTVKKICREKKGFRLA